MNTKPVSSLDRALAKVCQLCPVCRHARDKQAGACFRFVLTVESRVCPFCQAYERVHGRKSHAAAPGHPPLSRS